MELLTTIQPFQSETEEGLRRRNTITQLKFSKEMTAAGLGKGATKAQRAGSWQGSLQVTGNNQQAPGLCRGVGHAQL